MVWNIDEPAPEWVTASDLAEYTFCPRAYWYRTHPPTEGSTAASRSARTAGERYHARTLTHRTRRERWSGVWWFLIAAGALLILFAVIQAGRP